MIIAITTGRTSSLPNTARMPTFRSLVVCHMLVDMLIAAVSGPGGGSTARIRASMIADQT